MNKDKKLYKIENKLGTFYVVAGTFDEAVIELKERLDQADYGFFQDRDIPSIEHVATQSFYHDGTKQSFSDSKPNLIISGNDPISQREFAEQMAAKCEECEKLKHDYDQISAELADANEQLLKMQDEQESLQHLQQKLDDALAENRQLHERLRGVTATTGSYMIAMERERQVTVEGYDAEHDQCHSPMTLARAAVSYILCNDENKRRVAKNTYWPWEDKYYKPRDMKRNLIRAGALVAAAIDLLQAEDVKSPVEPCDKCPDEVYTEEAKI